MRIADSLWFKFPCPGCGEKVTLWRNWCISVKVFAEKFLNVNIQGWWGWNMKRACSNPLCEWSKVRMLHAEELNRGCEDDVV